MLEDKRAQDHYPSPLFVHLPFRVDVAYPGHPPLAVAVDASDFRLCPKIEVAGRERHGNHRIERRGLGMDVAAEEVAVAAVDTCGTFGNTRVERCRRAIRLGKHSSRSVVRVIAQFFTGGGEQFHACRMAQRREWEAAPARSGERVGAGHAGHAKLPLMRS